MNHKSKTSWGTGALRNGCGMLADVGQCRWLDSFASSFSLFYLFRLDGCQFHIIES